MVLLLATTTSSFVVSFMLAIYVVGMRMHLSNLSPWIIAMLQVLCVGFFALGVIGAFVTIGIILSGLEGLLGTSNAIH